MIKEIAKVGDLWIGRGVFGRGAILRARTAGHRTSSTPDAHASRPRSPDGSARRSRNPDAARGSARLPASAGSARAAWRLPGASKVVEAVELRARDFVVSGLEVLETLLAVHKPSRIFMQFLRDDGGVTGQETRVVWMTIDEGRIPNRSGVLIKVVRDGRMAIEEGVEARDSAQIKIRLFAIMHRD